MIVIIGIFCFAIGYAIASNGSPRRGYQPIANGCIGSGGLGRPPTGGSAVMRPESQMVTIGVISIDGRTSLTASDMAASLKEKGL
jgi:hypothetical protein